MNNSNQYHVCARESDADKDGQKDAQAMQGFFFTYQEIALALRDADWINCDAGESNGIETIFTDTRERHSNALFIALTGERYDAHEYLAQALQCGATLLCVDKKKIDKIPPGAKAVAVDSTVNAYQSLARFHRLRFPELKLIALTGSCGKTSTKEALRAIFTEAFPPAQVLATEGNLNNQIGVPKMLLRLNAEHRIAIIEMGTNHHGEIEALTRCARPDAALIVSIGTCHLEFLGSLEGVAKEKSKIFYGLPSDGTALIPYDSPAHELLMEAAKPYHRMTFGESPDADFRFEYLGGNLNGASLLLFNNASGERVRVDWAIPGRHQASNACAAAAMAASFGIGLDTIARGLPHTELPGMRMRKRSHHDALWINDAYNANPDSMKASLTWLSEFADSSKLLLILGDMGELGINSLQNHLKVLNFAREKFPDAELFAVGIQMKSVADALSSDTHLHAFSSAREAAKSVLAYRPAGGIVFLKASRSTHLEEVEPGEGN